MDYFTKIFNRLNIQHLRQFLLRGLECDKIDPKNYEERIEEARKIYQDFFWKRYPNVDEFEEVTGMIIDFAGVCEDVYRYGLLR